MAEGSPKAPGEIDIFGMPWSGPLQAFAPVEQSYADATEAPEQLSAQSIESAEPEVASLIE
jgi:hypothetical protein